jgi:hypothetical protein
MAPARFAVLRFSGRASELSAEAKTVDLLAFVNRRELRAIGAVSLAQYDPPWTLWCLRRNEVMVQVEV